jgi:hypothetical protein
MPYHEIKPDVFSTQARGAVQTLDIDPLNRPRRMLQQVSHFPVVRSSKAFFQLMVSPNNRHSFTTNLDHSGLLHQNCFPIVVVFFVLRVLGLELFPR